MTLKICTKALQELSPLNVVYSYRRKFKFIELKYEILRRESKLYIHTKIKVEILKKEVFKETYSSIYNLLTNKIESKMKNQEELLLGSGIDSNLLPVLPLLIKEGEMLKKIYLHKDIELLAEYRNSCLETIINKVKIRCNYKLDLLESIEIKSKLTGNIKLVRSKG